MTNPIDHYYTHSSGRLLPRTPSNWIFLIQGANYTEGTPALRAHTRRYLEKFTAAELYQWARRGLGKNSVLKLLSKILIEAKAVDTTPIGLSRVQWMALYDEALSAGDDTVALDVFVHESRSEDLSIQVGGEIVPGYVSGTFDLDDEDDEYCMCTVRVPLHEVQRIFGFRKKDR